MTKNIIAFYSDLRGTYLDQQDDSRINRVNRLFEKIEELRVVCECDEVKFYIITNDRYYDILQVVKEIKERTKNYTDIVLEKCFCDSSVIENDKITDQKPNMKSLKLIEETNELSKEYNVKKVIYAEDSEFYIYVTKQFFKKLGFCYDNNLILVKDGLNSVIEELESIITIEKKTLKFKKRF